MLDDNWVCTGEYTQDYCIRNRAILEKNISMILNFEDVKTLEKISITDLVHDFGSRYKRNEIESVDEYFELLDNQGHDKLLFTAGVNRSRFEDIQDFLDDLY